MGSATVPVAVFGVAPKTFPKLNGSTNGSGATPEPARETRALPPIVHPKMKTGIRLRLQSGTTARQVRPSQISVIARPRAPSSNLSRDYETHFNLGQANADCGF
jgi:hypothetical protein